MDCLVSFFQYCPPLRAPSTAVRHSPTPIVFSFPIPLAQTLANLRAIMATAHTLARAAAEKSRAAARLGASLRAPQTAVRHNSGPHARFRTSKFTPRAQQPYLTSPRLPFLLPPRVPPLVPIPMTSGALHFRWVGFSTKGKTKEAASAADIDADADDCDDIPRSTDAEDAAQQDAAAAGGDAQDGAGGDAERPKSDEDLFEKLKKFMDERR